MQDLRREAWQERVKEYAVVETTWDQLTLDEREASEKGYDRPTPAEVFDDEERWPPLGGD